MTDIYTLHRGSAPLLISLPHDGSYIPDDIAARMRPDAQRSVDTDWHVGRLYEPLAKALGASVIRPRASRYVVDLNRPADGHALYPGKRETGLVSTIGFDGGFLAEAGVSYAGPNAQARARLAGEVVWQRLSRNNALQGDLRIDMIGINSLHGTAHMPATDSEDVRLRVAMRSRRRDDIDTMMWEVESLLCCGPAGGGGYRGQITPSVVTHSALIERERVTPRVELLVA